MTKIVYDVLRRSSPHIVAETPFLTSDSQDISPGELLASAMLVGLEIFEEEDALTRLTGDTIAASARRSDGMTWAFRPQPLP